VLKAGPCRVSGFLFPRARKSSLVPPSIVNYSVKEMESLLYTPLDIHNHEIRLLRIIAETQGLERGESPYFFGFLDRVSLIDYNRYTALSYCWGNSSPSEEFIRLKGYKGAPIQKVPITWNLNSALWALWGSAGDKADGLRVWVDAICINQGDTYERSQQVQIMRQIYSKAESVFAWVGPVAGKVLSPPIFKHLSAMQTVNFRSSRPLNEINESGNSQTKQPILDSSQSEEESASLKAFFDEEYWKRVWIIQEITVASTVKVLYGGLEFSWEKLAAALSTLVYSSKHGADDYGFAASHLLKFREHWVDGNKPISLIQAMEWTLHTKATDPRDKIFALLGLCHDGFRLVQIPNYKQSLESIVSEMTRLSFNINRSLDLLCLKGTGTEGSNGSGLPSWAPNWPNIWSGGTTILEKTLLIAQNSFQFNPVLSNSTTSIIEVEAIYVGRIEGITSGLVNSAQHTWSRNAPGSWIFSTQNLREDIPELNKPSRTQVTYRWMIWKTLMMNYLDLEVESRDSNDCFTSLWTPHGRGSIYNTQVIDWIDRNAWFKIGPWTLREWSQLRQSSAGLHASRTVSKTVPGLVSVWREWRNKGVDFRPAIKATTTEIKKQSPIGEENKITVERSVSKWEAVNQILEQVLGSGMRLAELVVPQEEGLEKRVAAALVNPYTEVSDEIFFLRGCSIPVALRRAGNHPDSYEVLGGAWLDVRRLKLDTYQSWAQGSLDKVRDEDIRVLSLI
jgi:hypothetical protein